MIRFPSVVLGLLAMSGLAARSPAQTAPSPEIAFADMNTKSGGIKVMNADGSNVRTVVPYGRQGKVKDWMVHPCWSPDGQQLAFSAKIQGVLGIYVVNLDGSGRRLVASTVGYQVGEQTAPDWSRVPTADGKHKIVFASGEANSSATYLYVVNPDGTGLLKLPNAPEVGPFHFGWTRDCQGLLRGSGGTSSVLHLGTSGGQLTVTGETVLLSGARGYPTRPRSSNGGVSELAAYHAFPAVAGHLNVIWVLDLSSLPGVPRQLTAQVSIEERWPSFSPDDTRVVFQRDGIYTIRLDGTGETRIHASGVTPAWRRS